MGIVLSGVQPTGNLHLGNYLGAIKQWVDMQSQHNCLFMLADLHAITVPQDPAELRENVLKVAALYIACGINPEKSVIFQQSRISGHSELAWILGCNTPLGWLDRMTQFKDKAGKDKQRAALGLYSYPVLMAADILLYNATHVPVGEDQKQHLELARDIAGAFNRNFKTEFFVQPEPLIMGAATRVMSLKDGTKKMSKSDPSEQSRINLTDTADEIRKKVQKAQTDVEFKIKGEGLHPAIENLRNIVEAMFPKEDIFYDCSGYAHFKQVIAEAIVAKISPITAEYNRLIQDKAELKRILDAGAEKADEIAEKNLLKVKQIVGFV